MEQAVNFQKIHLYRSCDAFYVSVWVSAALVCMYKNVGMGPFCSGLPRMSCSLHML